MILRCALIGIACSLCSVVRSVMHLDRPISMREERNKDQQLRAAARKEVMGVRRSANGVNTGSLGLKLLQGGARRPKEHERHELKAGRRNRGARALTSYLYGLSSGDLLDDSQFAVQQTKSGRLVGSKLVLPAALSSEASQLFLPLFFLIRAGRYTCIEDCQ